MAEQRKNRDENTRPARRVKRELLKIDGKSIEVILRTNPRARRFIVKVDPSSGEVSVVAPSSRSFERALDFARKEKDWISGGVAGVERPRRLASRDQSRRQGGTCLAPASGLAETRSEKENRRTRYGLRDG